MTELTVGIDIGGTNTKYGIVDRSGHVHLQGNIATTKYEEFQDYFDAMAEALREGIKQLPTDSRGQYRAGH
jgi:glucokinase